MYKKYAILFCMNNIPRWNLDSIFSSIDSDEYKKSLLEFASCMDTVDSLLELADRFTKEANSNFDFASWLASYLDAQEKSISLLRTLNAYSYIVYSTDTTNATYVDNLSKVQELSIRLKQQEQKFSTMLLSHQKYLEEFYARFPKYKSYSFILEEVLESTKHKMSSAEEKLALDMQRTGGDAWSRLQEQLISNLCDESGKTFNELRNDAFSCDANVRKNSWQKEIELLSKNKIAFAASLNNLKGETLLLNSRRNWQEALDRSICSARINKKTLQALISAIEDSLPMWQQYFKAKALLLRKKNATASKTSGTKEQPGIAFYDLFAPLSFCQEQDSLLSKEWTFSEAQAYIIEKYSSFSKEMGDFAKYAFDNNWVDAQVYSGKVGGAYDEDFPLGHQSRILTNFTGTFSDVITLAHELGHAYHFSCMKGKPSFFFDYPMTLAETASTFAETIVKQDIISKSSGTAKINSIELDLQDTSQVLVDILCRFYFEQSVFEQRAKGELNADDFCHLMKEAQQKTYGDGLNTECHEYMWAVKSHYYITDLDFYNFPYAFGQLFAASLYLKAKEEGQSFAKTYATLLSETGNKSCESLCQQAGFDITSKEFWANAIKMYQKEVLEFNKFVEEL